MPNENGSCSDLEVSDVDELRDGGCHVEDTTDSSRANPATTFNQQEQRVGQQVNVGGDAQIGQVGDKIEGDQIVLGNIANSFMAIGRGAQLIVKQIQQASSAVDEMEKIVRVAERRLAEAIQNKLDNYTRLTTAAQVETRSNPYKALLDYEIEDAPFFYGRQEAIRSLQEIIRRGRLTILESDSGSGKTSLLQAGLASRMLADGKFALYSRPYNLTPEKAIKKAFLPDYETQEELARFRDMTLVGFLERLTFYLGDRGLYIFLDQFEEFFKEISPAQRRTFSDQLRDVTEADLPVRWVLALRKEYLSELRLFEDSGLKPFGNKFFLPTFRIQEAQEVLIKPAGMKGVRYEDGLVDRILTDICQESQSIPPVQAQLVCYTLFDELTKNKNADQTQITLDLYEKKRGRGEGKPGAEGILTSHLTRVLDEQLKGKAEHKVAVSVLEALITSDRRRAIKPHDELLVELRSSEPDVLSNVLQILVNNRLLRTDRDENNDLTYELAHDFLLREIELDPTARARKLAQEILDQEVHAWKGNPKLRIPTDKLALLNAQRSMLILDDDARHLMELSRVARRNERLRSIGGIVLATIGIAVVSTLALTGQLPRFIYRPGPPNLIAIPAGPFEMGTSDEEIAVAQLIKDVDLPSNTYYRLVNEQPQHTVFVDAFQIDKFEVTNKEYYQCVRSTICSPPSNSTFADPENAALPVTDINWTQADTYCQWSGGRLPTEAEWERAARYGSTVTKQRYAWGEDIDADRANVFVGDSGKPLPVGSFSPAGDTVSGLADMTGNVWEWVADWYGEEYYSESDQNNPRGPESGRWRITRGGSYMDDWVQARIVYRKAEYRTGDSAADLGFRCVR